MKLVYLWVYIYIYIYIYRLVDWLIDRLIATSFTVEIHLFDYAESTHVNACNSLGQITPCKPCCIWDKSKNVGVEITRMYTHIASQNYCRPTYFVTELTRIACKPSRMKLFKITRRLFVLYRSHMIRKYSF